MAVHKITEKTIARDVVRGGEFLRALGTRPKIRALLIPRGYDEAEHRRLWQLMLVLMGYNPEPVVATPSGENLKSLTLIDNSDGPLLRAIAVVLEDRYPDQYRYITAGLSPQEGTASVGVVQHVLDRYACVRDGTDAERASQREEDKEAAELLAARGVLDANIEASLRDHLGKATAIAPVIAEEPSPEAQEKYEETAREFHISLKMWRELARQTITRRDYLITLGLAERRKPKRAKRVEDDDMDDRPMD